MKLRLLHAGIAVGLVVSSLSVPQALAAQKLPLSPIPDAGQSVTPAFEGWYKNPDGSFSLSFGYYNRNEREVLDIPIGKNNFITAGDSNQGQPTNFQPGRHWGVFALWVPADFGDKQIAWTLSIRGQTYSIPASLKRGWEIDAIEGEGTSGNVPPTLRFEADGAVAQGPGGAYGKPITAKVGTPITIEFWAADEPGRGARGAGTPPPAPTTAATTGAAGGRAAGSGAPAGGTGRAGRGNAGPTLTWFKHQGTGDVTFTPASPRVDAATGKASTTVSFSAPGVYVLRLRANDSAVASAGHAQCCWTNGFIKVTVSR
jgi:hypothetical protein